jgi:hypothetical protein
MQRAQMISLEVSIWFSSIHVKYFSSWFQYDEYKTAQEAEVNEKGQTVSENVYYLKQIVTNACGTIALVHSIANNTDE